MWLSIRCPAGRHWLSRFSTAPCIECWYKLCWCSLRMWLKLLKSLVYKIKYHTLRITTKKYTGEVRRQGNININMKLQEDKSIKLRHWMLCSHCSLLCIEWCSSTAFWYWNDCHVTLMYTQIMISHDYDWCLRERTMIKLYVILFGGLCSSWHIHWIVEVQASQNWGRLWTVKCPQTLAALQEVLC